MLITSNLAFAQVDWKSCDKKIEQLSSTEDIEAILSDLKEYSTFEPIKTQERLDRVIFQCEIQKDDKNLADALNFKGVINYNLGRYELSLNAYLRSIDYKKKVGSKIGVANVYGNIGAVYSFIGDYENALKSFESALEIWEELDNQPGLAKTYGNIGVLYANDFEEQELALEYFQKALKIEENLSEDYRIDSRTLMNIASVLI